VDRPLLSTAPERALRVRSVSPVKPRFAALDPPCGGSPVPLRLVRRRIALVLHARPVAAPPGDAAGAARLFEAAAPAPPSVRPAPRADAGLPPPPRPRARAPRARARPRGLPDAVRARGARRDARRGLRPRDPRRRRRGARRRRRGRRTHRTQHPRRHDARAPGAGRAALRGLPRPRRVHALPLDAPDHGRRDSRPRTGTRSSTTCRTADALDRGAGSGPGA
jgi:hypothetical protein